GYHRRHPRLDLRRQSARHGSRQRGARRHARRRIHGRRAAGERVSRAQACRPPGAAPEADRRSARQGPAAGHQVRRLELRSERAAAQERAADGAGRRQCGAAAAATDRHRSGDRRRDRHPRPDVPRDDGMSPRHFLDLSEIAGAELRRILEIAARFKAARASGPKPLAGRTLAMIFDRPSTRTRVAFEVGMTQLGGTVVTLQPNEMQIGRGETIADTARVLSRSVDIIVMRTADTDKLYELARHATVPVINGLTRRAHPCQLMADVMTFEEHRGPIAGKIVAWAGDGNNMACTWIQAAARFAFELRLACPPERQPDKKLLAWAKSEGATIK